MPVQPADSAAQRAERAVPVLLSLFERCVEALTQDQADEDSDPVLSDRCVPQGSGSDKVMRPSQQAECLCARRCITPIQSACAVGQECPPACRHCTHCVHGGFC